jgi:hypothetical protein
MRHNFLTNIQKTILMALDKNKQAGKTDKKKSVQPENTKQAKQEAEKDIQYDPDLSIQHKTDDMDEGELARADNSNDKI